MFFSYIKIALRNIVRQKLYSGINILGLAIGVAACIIILLYVQDELSYDRWNTKADRIYRVTVKGAIGGNEFEMALSTAPLAATLVADYPEVEDAGRITYTGGYPVLRYGDKAFSEERWASADSNIFDIFDFEFVLGDPKTALNRPNSIVMTESMADRYFGDENPIGKMVTSDKTNERMVTGVIKDIPHNSHFHYEHLLSLITNPQRANNPNWMNNNFYTFVVLKEGTDYRELEAKFPDMIRKYVGPQIEQALGVSWDQLEEDGSAYQMYLQPLTDIHLHSHLDREVEVNGNMIYVYVFSIIAVFILIIACINFMNLATARSANRAREVGVRKTLGSDRGQLVRQFLVESIILTLISIFIAVVVVELILPWFNNLVGLNLTFNYGNLPYIIIGAILVGILAGSYPAFFLSSFDPVKVLKGPFKSNGRGSKLRSGLVIFQFTISILLFTGTVIVRNQLSYMQNQDLGYTPENLLVVEKTDDIGDHIEAFKTELAQYPNILEVSNATSIPGEPTSGTSVLGMSTPTGDQFQLLHIVFVDSNFADTYGLEMADGRFFSAEYSTDSITAVINEAAVRAYGIDDPVGRELIVFGGPDNATAKIPIIGVVKDFHYESLHSEISPLVMGTFGQAGLFGGQGPRFGRYTTLRINPDDLMSTLNYIEDTWMGFAIDQQFEYVFFDDLFNALYDDEARTRSIAAMFAVLAVLIACLGLLGLASFTAEQRTKEIGIRKVLGATVASIFRLLSNDILKLVVISALLSLPLSWYVMNNWLENFAYHINYSVLTFFVASIVAFVIAILTITWQALKAALTNPIEALRYE
ncbi:ABC transporter permease [Candidatus Neomarinimicrobiota bacterium]